MSTYAPGDRVRVALYGANGAPTNRIATVTAQPEPDAVSVVLGDGVVMVVGPDALTLLPPATRKRSKPGQGRPASRWVLHTGDVFVVTEIDATAGRVTLTAATGERIVMPGETQEARE